ncbi:hypothetical protein EGI26_05230 [Lacihabitans sp. CCS-44]|uniref:nuclear transport factor 2 family protein n=1 Tax=Lacihabitans sp. CCS-44 TaxID=2487331 RepID=UPI0020CFC61C|nr:nuclear transport factor 2 family protein [Lacihabitans sp. CCS-44]MCP9754566.1 hypothetical protein [Lacihabitans sp. CCS-44]
MKRIFFILILTFGYSKITFGQSEEAQIKKAIETFFDGMYKRDTMLIKSVLHKNCSLNSVNIKPDQAATQKSESIAGLLKSIGTIPQNVVLEERLLEHKIQIDEALAIDWTPYEFYVNEKLSHKGTNVFTLIKTENKWKIIAIIDTRKR